MREFKTWAEARAFAEATANKTGVACGIEKPTTLQSWTVRFLPRPENRYGWETRCEAVEPCRATKEESPMRIAHYQKRIRQWIMDTYGVECLLSRSERAARVLEEALELAQAEGIDEAFANKILARAYARPTGDPRQEFAGIGVTLLAYATATGMDLDYEVGAEIQRVESLDKEKLRAKHQEKVRVGASTITTPTHAKKED